MRVILYILSITFCTFLQAQQLDIVINKTEIKIGEPFILTFQIKDKNPITKIQYTPQLNEFIGKESTSKPIDNSQGVSTDYHFDILQPFHDTTYQVNGEYIWQGTYELTGWDSAYVVIPPESIQLAEQELFFPAGLIGVIKPLVNPNQPIYDIRESFSEIPSLTFLEILKKYWWAFALALIGLIILVFLLVRKGKKRDEPVIQLSFLEEALLKIKHLRDARSYDKNLKEYYYELSIIIRKFLVAHFKVELLDKTTYEIEIILRKHALPEVIVSDIRLLLNQSDMVKFAKSKPDVGEILRITDMAENVLKKIAQIDS